VRCDDGPRRPTHGLTPLALVHPCADNAAMLSIVALVLTAVVGLLHVYFMVLETFLWTHPRGLKTFRQTKEDAEKSKVLAGNQGVYNGVLGAFLIWAAILADGGLARVLLTFVIIVGLYGGATVGRTILFVQALPAAIALALWYFA
jgi:putative membrane protein